MNKKYDFSLIRYTPDLDRGEGFNVGIIVFDNSNIELRWSDSFKPPKEIKSNWNKDNMLKWKEYFTEEFSDNALFQLKVNRATEEYVSLISNKISSNYGICPTRRHITSENSIKIVAEFLFMKLVEKQTKKRAPRATAKVNKFIKEKKFDDEDIFKHPIHSNYVLDSPSGGNIDFPFYQKNGILRTISAIKIKSDGAKISHETFEQIGKICQHRRHRKGKNDEYLVIVTGIQKPDTNIAELRYANTNPYLIDDYEEKKQLESYLMDVCVPL